MMSTLDDASASYFTAGASGRTVLNDEAVRLRESRQSVGAPDEVGGKARGERLAARRHVAQRPQLQPLGRLASHGDGVAILEAERREPAYAEARGKSARHAVEGEPRVAAHRRRDAVAQYGDEAGSRVLGIHVDRVGAERREGDLGCAESRAPHDGDPGRLEELREHLGQEVRLAERLAGDDDGGTIDRFRALGTRHSRSHQTEGSDERRDGPPYRVP